MTIYHGPDSYDAISHPTLTSQTTTEDRLELKYADLHSQTSPTNMDKDPLSLQHGQDTVPNSMSLATSLSACSLQTTNQASMPSTLNVMVPPTASIGEERRARILEVDIPTQTSTPFHENHEQNSSVSSPFLRTKNSDINRPSSPTDAPTLLMSSIISSDGSVYTAVPMSSELYIIPKTSRGFHWNGDLFLKPYQRRNLGIDHLYSGHNQPYPIGHGAMSGHGQERQQRPFGGSPPQAVTNRQGREGRGYHHRQDASVSVHEIHLEEHEIAGILPSWP
ncbi:hypothetical protein BGZ59_010641 [Podila verticillata]|nr:hypothetical protein BGZ59_010641 [Podila verticillata]KFH68910.1 hypothetical protein MVEG_05714 [Podila verticillata NRRL 6337]